MNRKTAMVVVLLLVMTLALSGAMIPEQVEAKPLPGCKIVGCTGGSDECLTLTVVTNGIAVSYHCYSSYRVPQQQ
jgi:hypothetical protein